MPPMQILTIHYDIFPTKRKDVKLTSENLIPHNTESYPILQNLMRINYLLRKNSLVQITSYKIQITKNHQKSQEKHCFQSS